VLGADLDDLEQEARIRLWQALRGEREIVYPASYIYRIAISVTIRALRRVRARKEDALLDADSEERSAGAGESALQASPGSSPAAIAERREWLAKIDLALTRLAENRRVAVGLHLQGFTTTEIGNLLGWSEAKARNLVHRGLKDLRRELAAAGMEYGG
jgi:RNA polymerase sigma factor (sigma-70 family)